MRGGVEVTTGVTGAAALHSIHANCDCALVTRTHVVGRVREPTLYLRPLARTPLKLPTDLEAEDDLLQPASQPLAADTGAGRGRAG